ncbi:MAG: preprotein translocase subunit SecE [Endomicrobium sp.]|jgi:preprotein translocase subunit SecE|nr:preprotein translocase subunit SecE [Endomicrobium sp.]
MNLIKKLIQFFKSAYCELAKVTWLGRKEAVGTTVVVVLFVIVVSIFVSIIDLFIGTIMSIIL